MDPNSLSKYKTSILNRYLADSVSAIEEQEAEQLTSYPNLAVTPTPSPFGFTITEPPKTSKDSGVGGTSTSVNSVEFSRKRTLAPNTEKSGSKKLKTSLQPQKTVFQGPSNFLLCPAQPSSLDPSPLRPGIPTCLISRESPLQQYFRSSYPDPRTRTLI